MLERIKAWLGGTRDRLEQDLERGVEEFESELPIPLVVVDPVTLETDEYDTRVSGEFRVPKSRPSPSLETVARIMADQEHGLDRAVALGLNPWHEHVQLTLRASRR